MGLSLVNKPFLKISLHVCLDVSSKEKNKENKHRIWWNEHDLKFQQTDEIYCFVFFSQHVRNQTISIKMLMQQNIR